MAPDDRYETAGHLGQALSQALDEDNVRRRARIARRSRALRLGGALVVVAGLGVGVSRVASRRGGAPIERISVLPPTNLSGDSERETLLLGIHSALVNELSRAGVDVIGGVQSMMRYRGSTQTVREIAAEIGADAMVESSVFWAGDSVGIDVRLLDAETEGPAAIRWGYPRPQETGPKPGPARRAPFSAQPAVPYSNLGRPGCKPPNLDPLHLVDRDDASSMGLDRAVATDPETLRTRLPQRLRPNG